MVTGEAGLRLFQLVSPALPVGGFSYAEGLEVLTQAALLPDAAAVGSWLEAELSRGTVRIEAAALAPLARALQAWAAASGSAESAPEPAAAAAALAEVQDLQGWLLAQREAPEMRAQLRQMGRSLQQLLADLGWPLPAPLACAWPTAFAWAGVALAVPLPALVEGYLYAWTTNQLSAAVRLVPLGPTEAQRLQLGLAPRIAAEAEFLAAADPRSLRSGGVGAGLAQLRHAELYSRLFRS
ncbi:MAG: urease accessory protein UreF [Prochlorococcaceae cyanobacterium]|jgi:urease accessory protein